MEQQKPALALLALKFKVHGEGQEIFSQSHCKH